ncbi:hypothetical protein PLICRDRAFT_95497 [Plicaturopsis crispa FD-325 SS-3]|uniref:Auxin efflux carrier n=1 Tax=Plicaturopsis crispa FD-325 SS-3 TaxID=944288 RepID=A0A0C9T7H3_PLICR|nr:hypothetical protein PLICRDRAFT_95497 [Plicaturopsis crispa FD-325 SS-3]
MSNASFLVSFFGALQAAISVELTLFYGYAAARLGLVDETTSHKLSGLCTRVFLPCLIVVQCGPELTVTDIKELWVLFVWSFLSISLAFLIGWAGRYFLKLPGWAVAACAINNANAMPLLLLQSLSSTSALDSLAGWKPGETSEHAIARAKTYVLLYMIVQQSYGFLAGPGWLRLDVKTDDEEQPRPQLSHILQDEEHVGLLDDDELNAIPQQDAALAARHLTDVLQYKPDYPKIPRYLQKFGDVLNPPIVGALMALFIGLTPPLHKLMLNAGSSPLYPSLTSSLKNIGDLFTSLQMFVLGCQLYLTRAKAHNLGPDARATTTPSWRTSLFVLTVRFIIMPASCIGIVYGLVRLDPVWFRRDPMLWFVMMISPSGPSAILLAALGELVHVDEAQIAAFLFISYLVSPLISVVVSLAIEVIGTLQ